MKFAIAVYSPPGPTANTAYQFARTALAQGHEIVRLFFFNAGVNNCAHNKSEALCVHWQQLITTNQIDAIACSASAARAGLIQAKPDEPLDNNHVHPLFNAGGIAQLIDAGTQCDRLLSFGG